MLGSSRICIRHQRDWVTFALRNSSIRKCSSEVVTKIEIPKRIERSPTAILEALARTVHRDPTANHYKYPDDPHIQVYSNHEKRSLALSLESGRKAAWWIVNKHSNLFVHREMDPIVEAFLPKERFTEENVDENVLVDLIQKGQVLDAQAVYELLEQKKISLSNSTKQQLLELLCFYNSDEREDERLLEEKWVKKGDKEPSAKTWKDQGLAENLFISLEDDPKAICTMILGRLKYLQVSKAYDLYQKAVEKEIPLTTEVYNALIGTVCNVKDDNEMRWATITEFLNTMYEKNISVNIGTLNSVLKSLAVMKNWNRSIDTAAKTLSEFKKVGVEPSLGSYYYLLQIIYRRPSFTPSYPYLGEILSRIEGKQHQIQDEADVKFFPYAMKVCSANLTDISMAHRLNKVLHYEKNINFIADAYHESTYYREFVKLIFMTEPIEVAMEYYTAFVPTIYTPEQGVLLAILNHIETNKSYEYIPRLWEDIFHTDLVEQENIMKPFLQLLVKNQNPDEKAIELYNSIAAEYWNRIETPKSERFRGRQWNEDALSCCIILFCQAKNFKLARNAFQRVQLSPSLDINVTAIASYLDVCLYQKSVSSAIACLEYCSEQGYPEIVNMAEKVKSQLTLNPEQSSVVSQLTASAEKELTKEKEKNEEFE